MTARNLLIAGIIVTQVACQSSVHNIEAISPDPLARKADTSNQYIYDFMKIVIADQKLDLNYGLQLKPDWGEGATTEDTFFMSNSDIEDKRLQEEKLKNFFWDNSRLGFNLSNDEHWYVISIPVFSKDQKKVVINIEDKRPDLFVHGLTVEFIHAYNKWTSTVTYEYD